jgi:hypothetical protein
MSVGHVARILEEAGIPTVIIAIEAFEETLLSMSVARVLFTPFPLGRPIGFPGNKPQHLRVLKTALNLLNEATQIKTVKKMNERYLA